MPKKVAIYGGAFDPPHFGHAEVIKKLAASGKFHEIWIMPTSAKHGKRIKTPAKHRIEMIRLMVDELLPKKSVPVKISLFELKQKKWLPTFRLHRLLKKKYPKLQFTFAFSPKTFRTIARWVDGKKFLSAAKLVKVSTARYKKISSTQARDLAKQKRNMRAFLPRPVAKYIEAKKLYLGL